MALIRCDFDSEVLELSTSMNVILPEGTDGGTGHPTLYLLHGLSDDATSWLRYSSIERYVADLGLAVVAPQVHRSFYCDEAHGGRYWTFLSEELPALAGSFFRLSGRRADTFVAGLSMGGYGAIKWALRQPERFAAAASLSGALDVARRQQEPRPQDVDWVRRVFGDRPVAGTDDDLLALLDRADPAALPRLYVCCGTEDELYPDNVRFRDACQTKGVALSVDFAPGEHEWGYWDRKIRDILAWLPVRPLVIR
jgi:S-formylglutathione hydrolase FrmB